MARDESTVFQHQQWLVDEKPDLNPELIREKFLAGEVQIAKSYNMVFGPDEVHLAIRSDKKTTHLRVNPDFALNLALNLLDYGNRQKWFSVDVHHTNPPKAH